MYEIYKRLRDRRGETDADVARGTGLGTSTFADWKSGRSTPKLEKLLKIARYFGVSVSYLIGEDVDGYYVNRETAETAQEIFDNPDLRALFSAARGSKPQALRMAAEMLTMFKATNNDPAE